MIPHAYESWVLARVLSDQPINGEPDTMSEPWKSMVKFLIPISPGDRLSHWDGMLADKPDRDEVNRSIADQDPKGPAPVVQSASPRRAARLSDLASASASGRFVWPNWIVRAHFTLISSNPKCGKTRFGMEVSKRVYNASSWPDGQPAAFPAGTTSLWVAGDRHQEELRDMATEYGLPHDALCLNALPEEAYGGWDLDNSDNVKLLAELIEIEKPGLVFIDTVWRATRKKLCREDEVNKFIDPIISIAQHTGTSILGLMHLSRDMETLGRRLEGSARGIIKILKPDPKQPNRRRLEVIGNFKETAPLGITMRDGGCDFDLSPPKEPEPVKRGPVPVRLAECKEWLKGQLTPNPVAVQSVRTESGKAGFGANVLYQAMAELNVEEYLVGGYKWWKLPVVPDVQDKQPPISDNKNKVF